MGTTIEENAGYVSAFCNCSFPRKFLDDFTIVDKSGGSTPSATLPLVMGYKYFKDKRYLDSAKRTAGYLEKELISKADYFSSTLDANCEDKEASLYAATATYYLSLVTKGEEHKHYADLTKQAAYFALSWYYLWDVYVLFLYAIFHFLAYEKEKGRKHPEWEQRLKKMLDMFQHFAIAVFHVSFLTISLL